MRLLALGLMCVTVPATAQTSPAKLVLAVNGQLVITDYPSMTRCLSAVREVQARDAEGREKAMRETAQMPAGVIIPASYHAFCIPG